MIFLDDPKWVNTTLPNLPEKYKKIYISLLYTFFPQAVKKYGHIRAYEAKGYKWNFPFVFTDHEYDHWKFWDYEDWQLYVESSMIADYGLTQECFDN